MSSESLILAIDGGGTSTTACLAGRNAAGEPTTRGQSIADQSNPAVVGFERCLASVLDAAEKAVNAAGLARTTELERVVIGLAGIEATDFRQPLAESVGQRIASDSIEVLTDVELLLLAGSGNRATVGLISGTGSVAVGRTLDGKMARSGGRGFLTGDAGSGFWIGQQGFTAAIQALDHIGPGTQLEKAIARIVGSDDAGMWTNYVYASDKDPRSVVASFSPLVLQAAQEGDEVATQIIHQTGFELAKLVRGVSKQIAISTNQYDLVLAGGVLVHQQMVRDSLATHLESANLRPAASTIVTDPAVTVATQLVSRR